MKYKGCYLRIIQLWNGASWVYCCSLFPSEMTSFFRSITDTYGAIKARYRLSGCFSWHYVLSTDF